MTASGYDIHAIRQRLPHRYPFLMIDRVIETGPDFATGLKNVTANEPYFAGHFPEHPIMPGVMITEALLQTCAFIGAGISAAPQPSKRFLCVGFSMKFQQTVLPGDQLRLEVRLIRAMGAMTKVSATARIVDGGVAAAGDLTIAIQHEEEKV